MARCYYLDYISKGFLSSYDNDEYVCKLCGKRFATNDPPGEVHLQPRLRRGIQEVSRLSRPPLTECTKQAPGHARGLLYSWGEGTPPCTGGGCEKGRGVAPPFWSYSLSATASSQEPWKSSMRPWSTSWASSGSMGILASRGRPYSSAACWVLPSPKG